MNAWTGSRIVPVTDWIEIDYRAPGGCIRSNSIYLDDGEAVTPPKSLRLLSAMATIQASETQCSPSLAQTSRRGRSWKSVRPRFTFPEQDMRRAPMRVLHHEQRMGKAGLTENRAWGSATALQNLPTTERGNLAFSRAADCFRVPRHRIRNIYGGTPGENRIDGKINSSI